MKRRDFIKKSTSSVALSLLPAKTISQEKPLYHNYKLNNSFRKTKVSNPQNIVVIGAGIAGLTAAYYLKKIGHKVTVIETSDHVGGRMASENFNGTIIDSGAQFLTDGFTLIPEIIFELGLEREIVTLPYETCLIRKKQPYIWDQKKYSSLLTSGYLNLYEWIDFGIKNHVVFNDIKNIDFKNYSEWHKSDYENGYKWFVKNFNKKFHDDLIFSY